MIKLVPAETARKYQIVPLSRSGATLTIAMTDPTNVFAMDDVKFMTGYNVEPVVASETGGARGDREVLRRGAGRQRAGRGGGSAIQQAHHRERPRLRDQALEEMPTDVGEVEVLDDLEEISAEALTRQGEEAPVIKLVNVILMSAISKGASDIHIEPYEKEYRVRFRIDGILYNMMAPSLKMRDAITSRIKIHGEARHRREAPAAGRPHQDPLQRQGRQQGHRLPRLVPADAVRREDRHAPARQGQAHARHDHVSASSRSR